MNGFGSNYYTEIIFPKLIKIYNGCVPCVLNHYLKKPEKVVCLNWASNRYYEGYINTYCRHAHCCESKVSSKIMLYSYSDRVEASLSTSENRSHFIDCVKSRSIKGIHKKKLMEQLQFQKRNSVYRNLHNSLEDEERVYGAHTYAPSQAVLRNLKSKECLVNRYSDSWLINLEVFAKKLHDKNKTFIRDISIRPPAVVLYSDEQMKAYSLVCIKSTVYFDATGSVVKRFKNEKDFQI